MILSQKKIEEIASSLDGILFSGGTNIDPIKYGELTTKKDNRNFFINSLKKNIFSKLSNFEFDIIDDYYRMFIIPKNDDIDDIAIIIIIIGLTIFALTAACPKIRPPTIPSIEPIGPGILTPASLIISNEKILSR